MTADYTVRFRRGQIVNGQRGFEFEISDHRGHVIRTGWSAGKRSDAEQDAAQVLRELRARTQS